VSRFVRRADLQREGESPLVGDEFAEFFRATRVHLGANGSRDIPAGYWVGVVLEGSGEIEYGAGRAAIRRGDTFCVPFALGSHRMAISIASSSSSMDAAAPPASPITRSSPPRVRFTRIPAVCR